MEAIPRIEGNVHQIIVTKGIDKVRHLKEVQVEVGEVVEGITTNLGIPMLTTTDQKRISLPKLILLNYPIVLIVITLSVKIQLIVKEVSVSFSAFFLILIYASYFRNVDSKDETKQMRLHDLL